MTADTKKRIAAEHALDFIEQDMVIGLGTGSTAEHFVEALAKRVWEGLSVQCVSTSVRTAELARVRGIDIFEIDKVDRIHVTVDGADEVDPQMQLIKGGGGALLREKIVAAASDMMVVIVDDGKMVDTLGAFPLPVEVVPFGFTTVAQKIRQLLIAEDCPGRRVALRETEETQPFVTDGGHYILDCACQSIPDPARLARQLSQIPGVVDHGLFINMATAIIVGHEGDAQIIEKQ